MCSVNDFQQLTVSLCLIIPGDLSTLIDFFSFASWLFYGITTVALLVLRVTEPGTHRPYKVSVVTVDYRTYKVKNVTHRKLKCGVGFCKVMFGDFYFFMSVFTVGAGDGGHVRTLEAGGSV